MSASDAAAPGGGGGGDGGGGGGGEAGGRGAGPKTTAVDPSQVGGLCRFYPQEWPLIEELVVVNVREIAEMGAYVTLLEYGEVEGMILLSELSRRRIRSISRLLRVGRNEVVMVIRVDVDKGYIDLSKRRATPEDVVKAEERYSKAKAVHAIAKHVSLKLRVPMLSLYERVFWPLYRVYGHAYEALQVAVAEPDAILGPVGGTLPEGMCQWPLQVPSSRPAGCHVDITPEERAEIYDFIQAKMKPQPLRIRADIQVTCVKYEGIEAVRAALLKAQACSTEAVPIKVQLIAPPLYVMTTTCLDKAAGIDAMNRAVAAAKAEIEARGGQLAVKKAPTVTSSRDDSELQRMLSDLEAANAEISGDEDSDADEESDDDAEADGDDELTKTVEALGLAGGDDGGIGGVPASTKKTRAAAAAPKAKAAAAEDSD